MIFLEKDKEMDEKAGLRLNQKIWNGKSCSIYKPKRNHASEETVMKPDKYVLPPKTKSLEVRGTGRWEEKYVHTGRGTEEDGWCPLDT